MYLTEDNFAFPSGLYRYVPPANPMRARRLANGGRLQMLRVKGQPEAHLEAEQTIGATYAVEWVDIDDPDPDVPVHARACGAHRRTTPPSTYVGDQGRAQGAAHFSRLEGADLHEGRGLLHLHPGRRAGGDRARAHPRLRQRHRAGVVVRPARRNRLTCRYQSPGTDTLELPDNVTARSDRGTIVLCEDGPVDNYIRGLDHRRPLFDIALNRLTRNNPRPRHLRAALRRGVRRRHVQPRRRTLFVNIQASQAITFAIWGPWGRLGV